MAGWREISTRLSRCGPNICRFILLEVHQGTPLADHIKNGLQPKPDEDLAAEMYEVMLERAVASGYEHYEISNLCLPGFAVATQHKILDGGALLRFRLFGAFIRW